MSDVCNYPLGDGKYCANDAGDGHIYCPLHRRYDPLAQQLDDHRALFEQQAAAVRHHTDRADAAEHQRDKAQAEIRRLTKARAKLAECLRQLAEWNHRSCRTHSAFSLEECPFVGCRENAYALRLGKPKRAAGGTA